VLIFGQAAAANNSPLHYAVEMEDEFLMKVTEVCADPASQQGEKQMGGLKMSWNIEGGRLVCRWVELQRVRTQPVMPQSSGLAYIHGIEGPCREKIETNSKTKMF
jgi:hypothetical protein